MLGQYYLTIDDRAVEIPARSFDIDVSAVEKVNQSEAGTDVVISTRLNKRKFSASWEGVPSDFADLVESWCTKATVTLDFRGVTYVCRARGYKCSLPYGAYAYPYADGLYSVSCVFTEI